MGCCTSKSQRKNVNGPIQAHPPQSNPNVRPDGSPAHVDPEAQTKLIEPIPIKDQSPKQSPKKNGVPEKETPTASQRLGSVHRIPSPIKPVPVNACCYIFGIDADNAKKIFKFDPKTETFSPLTIPANLEVYNMSACAYVSENCVYITGGIDPHTGKISNRAFIYNPERNTAEELPPFRFERYTHQAAVFKDQLYIIGGLGHDRAEGGEEQENILKSVERYDLKTRTWTKVSDLYFGRSLATVMVYQDTLYALGGYIGETKRTRTIEKLNPQSNNWEIIPFKLPRGLEAPYVFCPGPDRLQFIGGQDATGSVSINYVYDLLEDTYIPKKPMVHPRVLHKGFLYGEKIYVFGGDDNDTMEEYHIEGDEWVKQPSALKSLANGIKLFSYSQPTLQVDHDPAARVQQDLSPDLKSKKCFIFGDNDNSFILEVNFTRNVVRERAIPTNLKLFGYQGAALIQDGNYLLCGGINKHTKTISTKAYIYNPRTNSAKKLPKCYDARYTFSLIAMDNFVYAIGGRSWEEDNEAILGTCERYSLVKNQWEKIAKLNHPRCSAMAFRLKNKIYLIGGYKGNSQRWANIEVYHPDMNIWEALKIELKVALEGSSLVMANQRGDIFLLGGRTDNGDTDKIWEFDVEQGDMWEVGNLKEAKSLSKVYEFQERKVLILGGEKVMAEFFDLREGKTIEGNTLVNDINDQLRAITHKGRNTDTKLWKFSLA